MRAATAVAPAAAAAGVVRGEDYRTCSPARHGRRKRRLRRRMSLPCRRRRRREGRVGGAGLGFCAGPMIGELR
jgi:hypothetical protein